MKDSANHKEVQSTESSLKIFCLLNFASLSKSSASSKGFSVINKWSKRSNFRKKFLFSPQKIFVDNNLSSLHKRKIEKYYLSWSSSKPRNVMSLKWDGGPRVYRLEKKNCSSLRRTSQASGNDACSLPKVLPGMTQQPCVWGVF